MFVLEAVILLENKSEIYDDVYIYIFFKSHVLQAHSLKDESKRVLSAMNKEADRTLLHSHLGT